MANQTRNFGDLLNLIKYPSLTEKSVSLYENRQYTFVVDKSLTKTEIKILFEKLYNVKVTDVNTLNLPSKYRRVGKSIGKKSTYKKIYVKLQKGDSINDLFN